MSRTFLSKIPCLILLIYSPLYALNPDDILIIVNGDIPASIRIAQYYCAKRHVPVDNIISLPLGTKLNDTISRTSYDKLLAGPIRKTLSDPNFAGKIKCLLTTYGVPIKVAGRGRLQGHEEKLAELEKSLQYEKARLELLKSNARTNLSDRKKDAADKILRIQSSIDYINGKETNASVDSELSMVLYGDYELYRWQPNILKYSDASSDPKTLMVCRLDGPSEKIATALIDKAVAAEKTGLKGIVYIDSRGIADDKKPRSYGYFDQSLRDLATYVRLHTNLPIREEKTGNLFESNSCPQTAIYCGWYSLKKYVDSFDFVEGAIGYHISSFEAVDLRDPNSTQWCPAMLVDGITATIGAVAEPYLNAFPEPKAFFTELFNGRCLVEAYYRTNPFNSWQLILIGDPLYTPFKKPSHLPPDENPPVNLWQNEIAR